MNIEFAAVRGIFFAPLLALALLAGCKPVANSQAQDTAATAPTPVHVIVNMAAGQTPPAELKAKAAAWRKDGAVRRALWIDSVAEEKPTPGFASLLTLEFTDAKAHDAWAAGEGKALAATQSVAKADVLVEEKLPAYDPNITVFKVSYYAPTAPRAEIAAWVDGYLKHYLHAQLQAGILVSYAMYLVDPDSAQSRMLLVLQYHDATIAREAEPIKTKLNEEIAAKDRRYAELAALKEKLRTTQSVTLAEYRPLPSP